MRHALLLAALTAGAMSVPAVCSAAAASLTINPYESYPQNGAFVDTTGMQGPLVLPGNGGTPYVTFGFTVPADYKPGTAMSIVLLWESPETSACTFDLATNLLFRAREGRSHLNGGDLWFGTPTATTPTTGFIGDLVMEQPSPAGTTERGTFPIGPASGVEDADIRAGDAVVFGFFRRDKFGMDTCNGDLVISSVSVSYTSK